MFIVINTISGNNDYYDPYQIYMGKSLLRKRWSYKEAREGDIVVFGNHHVEIITEIQNNWIADNGFCSIGAGIGGSSSEGRDFMGKVKCNSFFDRNESRELKNPNNTYYQLP